MSARLFVVVAAFAALSVSAPRAAGDLVVVAPAGELQAAWQAVFFKPFASATAIPLHEETADTGLDALRARKSGAAPWDVVALSADDLLAACDEGLVEKLDWTAIGGKDHYLPAGVSDCGVGAAMTATVLAWDRDKFQGSPTWADFWDVAKYPGKRGLRRDPRANLEIALLADGVAPADIYRTLRTQEGVERAFRKLDQLRPYIVWWQSDADATHILGSGEVLMTSAGNGRIAVADRAEHRNFGIQWAGAVTAVTSWAIVKGSANLRQATQLLYFMGSSAIQARVVPLIPYPGLARGVLESLPPELAATLPLFPANQSGVLAVDEAFWRDGRDKLGQRFAAWLAH
jgi:putative spermidine/putrescine transport system substrate-binding protein